MPLCVCSECRKETAVFNGVQQQGRIVSRPTRLEHEKRAKQLESDSNDESEDEESPPTGDSSADPGSDFQAKIEEGV